MEFPFRFSKKFLKKRSRKKIKKSENCLGNSKWDCRGSFLRSFRRISKEIAEGIHKGISKKHFNGFIVEIAKQAYTKKFLKVCRINCRNFGKDTPNNSSSNFKVIFEWIFNDNIREIPMGIAEKFPKEITEGISETI